MMARRVSVSSVNRTCSAPSGTARVRSTVERRRRNTCVDRQSHRPDDPPPSAAPRSPARPFGPRARTNPARVAVRALRAERRGPRAPHGGDRGVSTNRTRKTLISCSVSSALTVTIGSAWGMKKTIVGQPSWLYRRSTSGRRLSSIRIGTKYALSNSWTLASDSAVSSRRWQTPHQNAMMNSAIGRFWLAAASKAGAPQARQSIRCAELGHVEKRNVGSEAACMRSARPRRSRVLLAAHVHRRQVFDRSSAISSLVSSSVSSRSHRSIARFCVASVQNRCVILRNFESTSSRVTGSSPVGVRRFPSSRRPYRRAWRS